MVVALRAVFVMRRIAIGWSFVTVTGITVRVRVFVLIHLMRIDRPYPDLKPGDEQQRNQKMTTDLLQDSGKLCRWNDSASEKAKAQSRQDFRTGGTPRNLPAEDQPPVSTRTRVAVNRKRDA